MAFAAHAKTDMNIFYLHNDNAYHFRFNAIISYFNIRGGI